MGLRKERTMSRPAQSRRSFLKTIALVPAASLPLAGAQAAVGSRAKAPAPAFFSDAELAFVDAAVSRLIPADDLGPGAKEAGVTVFIDRQLSGPYGRAETWYLQGPGAKGAPEQGYQLRVGPAQLYRDAIAAIDGHCRKQFQGKTFAQLQAAEQDKLLHALEKGDLHLEGTSTKDFFEILWNNTKEGFLADPMYGGNRGFAGWKLIGFPGPRYNYVAEIEQYGKRYAEPMVGLLGRDPDRQGTA
jgi:gluconate 2-dehydrogenase gamma chain